jgi:Bacterial Ig-like domain (group 3)
LNPANLGVSVTFTATVTTTGTNPPTGTVTFFDGATELGNGTTLNGSQIAVYVTPALAPGAHSITAVYNGDANNASSTSPVLIQTIIGPTFSWTANGNTTGTVLSGQSTTYNFTAAPTGGASSFVSPVTFSCSGLPDPTVSCSFSPAQIGAGSSTTSVQLTITTTGPNAPTGNKRQRKADNRFPWFPLALPFAGVVAVSWAGRKRSHLLAIASAGIPLTVLGLLVGCGSGGNGNGNPQPVMVSLSAGLPSSIFPNDGADNWPIQTAQFTPTVTNTNNTAVTWGISPANAGTISASGLYTAPTVADGLPSTVTITATSVSDPTKSAQATETLEAATVPGSYNVSVTATESGTVNSVPVMLSVQ